MKTGSIFSHNSRRYNNLRTVAVHWVHCMMICSNRDLLWGHIRTMLGTMYYHLTLSAFCCTMMHNLHYQTTVILVVNVLQLFALCHYSLT